MYIKKIKLKIIFFIIYLSSDFYFNLLITVFTNESLFYKNNKKRIQILFLAKNWTAESLKHFTTRNLCKKVNF